jgi:hypothetical protein
VVEGEAEEVADFHHPVYQYLAGVEELLLMYCHARTHGDFSPVLVNAWDI